MSEEDQIRNAMRSWNEGGFDAFAQHLAPDAVWHAPPEYPDGDVWRGREAIRESFREQFDAVFSNMGFDITELTKGPKLWFVAARATLHAEGSGMEIESRVFMVLEGEGELATEVWIFFDEAQARAQAGLA